jgi:hypothetical protein
MGYVVKTHSRGFLVLTFSALPGDHDQLCPNISPNTEVIYICVQFCI